MDLIKMGIIGIGRAGWGMHCSELASRSDKFTIVAACDLEQERVDKMAEKYSCAGYTDIDTFLTDKQVELVSIATRTPDHVQHTLQALAADKIVFRYCYKIAVTENIVALSDVAELKTERRLGR